MTELLMSSWVHMTQPDSKDRHICAPGLLNALFCFLFGILNASSV